MAFADPIKIEAHIADILNAAASWGGAIASARRSSQAITQARIESGMEILRCIAANPKNGYHASLATLTDVTHDQLLPAFDGEPGIPLIIPFASGKEMAGVPADPDEIDSWRNDLSAFPIYTGAVDDVFTAHDQPDDNNMPSAVAGRYSIVNGLFKFTGKTAKIPLIILTWTLADTKIPEAYTATNVKLAIPKLVKEGDNLAQYASAYAQAALLDLQQIMAGAMNVAPIPDLAMAQKAGVT